jgi:hypothetical protein
MLSPWLKHYILACLFYDPLLSLFCQKRHAIVLADVAKVAAKIVDLAV